MQLERLERVAERHRRPGMRLANAERPGYLGSWQHGVRSGWGREVTSDGGVVAGFFDAGRCEDPAWFRDGGDPLLQRGGHGRAAVLRRASQAQAAARAARRTSQAEAHAKIAAQKEIAAQRDREQQERAHAAHAAAEQAKMEAIAADPRRRYALRMKEERCEEGRRALAAMEARGGLARATRLRGGNRGEFAGLCKGNPKVFLPSSETGPAMRKRMRAAACEAFASAQFSGKPQLEGADNPGLVHVVSDYLSSKDMNIEKLLISIL